MFNYRFHMGFALDTVFENYTELSLDDRRLVQADALGVLRELYRPSERKLISHDYMALEAARELRRRIGGSENLRSYVDCLRVSAQTRGEGGSMDIEELVARKAELESHMAKLNSMSERCCEDLFWYNRLRDTNSDPVESWAKALNEKLTELDKEYYRLWVEEDRCSAELRDIESRLFCAGE